MAALCKKGGPYGGFIPVEPSLRRRSKSNFFACAFIALARSQLLSNQVVYIGSMERETQISSYPEDSATPRSKARRNLRTGALGESELVARRRPQLLPFDCT
jgi:hypothetical protein